MPMQSASQPSTILSVGVGRISFWVFLFQLTLGVPVRLTDNCSAAAAVTRQQPARVQPRFPPKNPTASTMQQSGFRLCPLHFNL